MMNFELFASHQNPVMKVFTLVGTGLFVGVIGYFVYNEQKHAKEQQEEEQD